MNTTDESSGGQPVSGCPSKSKMLKLLLVAVPLVCEYLYERLSILWDALSAVLQSAMVASVCVYESESTLSSVLLFDSIFVVSFPFQCTVAWH